MLLPEFLNDRDGEIRLTGHRIGLYTIVREYRAGWSAEQIVEEYPSLPLHLVRQVLDFYRQNRSEIDAYVAAIRAVIAQQEAQPPGPGIIRIRELRKKLDQADKEHDANPEWSTLPLTEKLRRLQPDIPQENR